MRVRMCVRVCALYVRGITSSNASADDAGTPYLKRYDVGGDGIVAAISLSSMAIGNLRPFRHHLLALPPPPPFFPHCLHLDH